MVEGVIFDMDGLMFDTEPLWTDTWPIVLPEFGYAEVPAGLPDACRGSAGEVTNCIIRSYLGEDADAPAMRVRMREEVRKMLEKGVVKKPGLDELLEFLAKNEKATFNDHEGHANLHTKWAETLTDAAAKEEALKKADAIYEDMAKRFNSNHEYILYRRANIANKLDPDQTKGLAKEHYQALIDRIAPKAEKDNSDKKILVTAYHYMMAYSLIQEKDVAKSKEYAAKILEVDPNYGPAQEVSNLNQ